MRAACTGWPSAWAPRLPEEFLKLGELVRWALNGGSWPRIASDNPAYFYTLRARADHPDRDLINQLLSELAPLDVRQLFITHKPAFYAAYRDLAGGEEGVCRRVSRTATTPPTRPARAMRCSAAREPEAKPATPAGKSRPERDIVDLVGPWGSVLRR